MNDLCIVTEGTPGGRLSNGQPSGLGVTIRYGVARVVDGRRKEIIRTFTDAASAYRLMDKLAGGRP